MGITTTISAPQLKEKPEFSPRHWQRLPVALPAELATLEGLRSGLVLNLCVRGAMVELALPPKLGSEVVLFCGPIEASGEIVWHRSQQCGIYFHKAIQDAELDGEAYWSRTWIQRILTR
jgi:PilZ domain